jgi:hypothetical protein
MDFHLGNADLVRPNRPASIDGIAAVSRRWTAARQSLSWTAQSAGDEVGLPA